MSFRLQFEGIRCFAEPQDAVVRPLTLLVGENSSGKSTFLALCRIAQAIAQRSPLHVPFNEAPFSLGAYDQIASKRPGRHGNVRSFSLTVSVGDEFRQSLLAEFVPRSGQPRLRVSRLASNNVSFEVAANEPEPSGITVHDSDGVKRVTVGPESDVPAYRDDSQLMAVMHTPIDEWIPLVEQGKRVLSESSIQSLEKARQAIQQEFRREPYAFAPVRTNPIRTYDPIDSVSDPEGSHVPMILATLARFRHAKRVGRASAIAN